MKPTYKCIFHGLDEIAGGCGYRLDMTVLQHHASGAPKGTRGRSSLLKSIDFERGIAVTLNSIYQFEPLKS
jgi:hypothetical protein